MRVIVGKPIGVEDLLRAAKQNEWSEDALYKAISQVSMHYCSFSSAKIGIPCCLIESTSRQYWSINQRECVLVTVLF